MNPDILDTVRYRWTARGGAMLMVYLLALAAPLPASAHGGIEEFHDREICQTVADKSEGLSDAPAISPLADTRTPVRFAQLVPPSPREEKDVADDEAPVDEKALADELAAMLQACSFDGQAIEVSAASLKRSTTNGEAVVRQIMRFTGLPQNFRVVEAAVPNAAAMILLGPDKLPQRVIAYNANFIARIRIDTQNNDWAAVSIMAHEIGHHLSGHTLMPGGSKPPIELEADRFSGFVLFKMGAALNDAQKAISTLVPVDDGPTHPGRPKRLAAVESGWTDSCGQSAGGCSGKTVATATPSKQPAASPQPAPAAAVPPAASETVASTKRPSIADVKIPTVADIKMPSLGRAGEPTAGDTRNIVLYTTLDTVPTLDKNATPGKFDRFVYDEVGIFDPAAKETLAKRAYLYAAANDVEIVTIIAKDLQGRTADEYALDAMRQLRVGKLEVGNGAVLVVAPGSKQTGVALGAGLSIQYEDSDGLRRYLKSYLDLVAGGARPQRASELIVDASSRIMRDTQMLEWAVRFPSLEAMLAEADAFRDRQRLGEKYDPAKDPTWRKLVRVKATLVGDSPSTAGLDVNAVKQQRIGPALHIRTSGGENVVVYANSNVAAMMPSVLEPGREYSFVLRDSFLAANAPQFDLISYDQLN